MKPRWRSRAECWGRIGERDNHGPLPGRGAIADPTLLPPSCGPGRARRGSWTGGPKRPRSVPRSKSDTKFCSRERPIRRFKATRGESNNFTGQTEQKCDKPKKGATEFESQEKLEVFIRWVHSVAPNWGFTFQSWPSGARAFECGLHAESQKWRKKNKKALFNSPSRSTSDVITVGASSMFDRLMLSMGTRGKRPVYRWWIRLVGWAGFWWFLKD